MTKTARGSTAQSTTAKATADGLELTLEEWMDLLRSGFRSSAFIDYCFLSGEHRKEFLGKIHEYTEDDVRLILRRFLMKSESIGHDKLCMAHLNQYREHEPEMYARMMKLSFYQRLSLFFSGASCEPPWQGVTWVTDLLPHAPGEALAVIEAYFLAHCQQLPDGRTTGLSAALEVIRARYIGAAGSQSERQRFLCEMDPRDFEHLVDALYSAMGYSTTVTARSTDGGRDIIARNIEPSRREQVLIECKRYPGAVGVAVVRGLLGVVSDEKVNKGVLVTTGRFTRPAIRLANRNPRIELIAGQQLVPLLNEYLGADWVTRIDTHVLMSRARSGAFKESKAPTDQE